MHNDDRDFNFSTIKTLEELRQYAQDKGRSRKYLWHYTSLNNYVSIIDSNSFWIKICFQQNDVEESISAIRSNNVVQATSSFSHDLDDNLQEWAMYGEQLRGVRFKIDKDIFCNTHAGFDIYRAEGWEKVNGNVNIDAVDVIYYCVKRDGTVILTHDGVENTNFNTKRFNRNDEKLKYFVKEDLWKNEFETRLIYNFPEKTFTSTRDKARICLSKICIDNIEAEGGPNLDVSILKKIKYNNYYGHIGRIKEGKEILIDISGM